jgi:hypothetical protein
VPREWRGEILAAASAAQPRRCRGFREEVSTWPSLRAWASLAAVWVVIFLLHLAAPDEPRLAGNSASVSMLSFAKMHEQTLMMAQLLGQPDQADAGEAAAVLPAAPKPRSEIARKQLVG